MELNEQCIYDILKSVQEEAKKGGQIYFYADELQQRHERLNKYDTQILDDCIEECMSHDFFDISKNGNGKNILDRYAINGLSRLGRAFLREYEKNGG